MDYLKLTRTYTQLEHTTKRLEKTSILVSLLKELNSKQEADAVLHLLRGSVFPSWDEQKSGISEQLVVKALAKSTGFSTEKIKKYWAKLGDLGEVTEILFTEKKQQTLFEGKKLDVLTVYNELRKLATHQGEGTVGRKIDLICKLLAAASGVEAKFIMRTLLEDLRVGIGEGVLRDSIVWTFFPAPLTYDKKTNDLALNEEDRKKLNEFTDAVQAAYDWTNDFAELYWMLKEKGVKGLDKISLKIGRPFNVMLAIKAETVAEAIENVGLPCLCDYKLDGFRVEIHHDGKNTWLYTRRLENVTNQFKEIIPHLKEAVGAKTYILDAEIVGFDPKTKRYFPFQEISQRIKRKYGIEALAKKIPVEVNIFDILLKDGKDLTTLNQEERRNILEKTIKEKKEKVVLTPAITATSQHQIEKFYSEALKEGVEGVMVKNLTKNYQPGRKVGGWIKLKPVLENLDLVITKAEYGTGKRGGTLSSYTLACLNSDKTHYLEIGKVATGLKEKQEEGTSFQEMTDLLKPLIIKQEGRDVFVKPKIVIEVAYEEIQKSEESLSGFSLRFPRFISLRSEKPLREINTIEDVKRIYSKQKGK